MCSHIFAVCYFNEIPVSNGEKTYKLSVLTKRGRGGEGRAGRKRPRAKDFDITIIIIEADDSILAEKIFQFATPTPKGHAHTSAQQFCEHREVSNDSESTVKNPISLTDNELLIFDVPSNITIDACTVHYR